MTIIDITKSISAKSDQLNADDLIGGPRTIRIRDVQNRGGEQPVWVYFDGDDGKPWKPGLTARRVLAAIWGTNAARWIGMSCTIFCDETVKWAGDAVGGIRISHMEGLSQPRVLKLAVTRGKKVPTTIQPLVVQGNSRADKIRSKLFAVAEGGGDLTVQEAWGKLSEADQADLGAALLDQLLALEAAAQEHRANDTDAAVADLNASLS